MVNIAQLLNLPSLEDELAVFEDALRASVVTTDPFLTDVAGHLIQAGGKRLRPALVMASAVAGGAEVTGDVVEGGISVELVHLGSLYHDDVLDEATDRRGVESVNARWGNLVAILSGDFLLARASEIAASLGTEVAGLLAATIARLCLGQVSEFRTAFDVSRTTTSYLESIAGKTASLMAASCRIGALTARLNRERVDALTAFGESLGMVFQIRDDILDLVGTQELLGKPPGQDLVEGIYNLPVIHALADPDAGPELRGLLGRPVGPPEREKARNIVRGTNSIAASMRVAGDYADRAVQAVEALPPGSASAAMARLGHQLLQDVPLE
ncbi:MAG TPA: polyprenyl synthetase family protein [Acidimicrobiales bacterium]|nr:polyprenyl synthetase family protein [Acidimicrobiales bacterium]